MKSRGRPIARSKRSQLAARILLALAATFVTLVAAETVVRRLHAEKLPVAHRIPDPILGWHPEPAARVIYHTSEFRVPVSYNSRGWRDVERTYEKPAGLFRVVVLGDSFMEAYSIPFEKIFAQQLASLLSESPDSQIEVINLGVGGYGTLQEYLAFVEEGSKYQPDLVLLGFYTNNDVADNSLALQRQIRQEASVKLRSRPFLDASSPEWRIIVPDYLAVRAAFERARASAAGSGPRRWVKQTALYGLARDVRQLMESKQSAGDSTDNVNSQQMGVYLCNEAPEYVEAWGVTERIFARLAADVRASGAELIVFSVPSDVEVMRSPLGEAFCLAEPPSATRLPGLLRRYQIPYADLLPAFRQAYAQGEALFWRLDGHWNEAGHRLAARAVQEMLLRHESISARLRHVSGQN